MSGPARARLAGGRDGRLHFQHGPIDLIIEAWGAPKQVGAAGEQAWLRFRTVLDELVAELPLLRATVSAARGAYPLARGSVARRMVAAVWPHREVFITPMAAVAGAVADEVLAAMLAGRQLAKAYVNDGGDIAIHVLPGEFLDAGIVDNLRQPALNASVRLERSCGIATSGWRGRSQSLGIADAVTAVAASAAAADAAATLIANAVNVPHPGIERRPACQDREDSDLGELPVTVQVPPLPPEAAGAALDCGLEVARAMHRRNLVSAAYLALQGSRRSLYESIRIPGDTPCSQTDVKS